MYKADSVAAIVPLCGLWSKAIDLTLKWDPEYVNFAPFLYIFTIYRCSSITGIFFSMFSFSGEVCHITLEVWPSCNVLPWSCRFVCTDSASMQSAMHYQILKIEAFACVFTLIQYPLQMFIIPALQYKWQYKILLIMF